MQKPVATYSWWSREQRPFTLAELVVDGIVHVLGLIVAIAAGSILLAFAILETAPEAAPALVVYVGSLVAVLGVSLAYNLWPVSPIKRVLARFDQAAIFLFIAGSYTPFLAVIGGTTAGVLMTTFVWGASLIGSFRPIAAIQQVRCRRQKMVYRGGCGAIGHREAAALHVRCLRGRT